MKYILTALFACTLAIGARAQSGSDSYGDKSGDVDKAAPAPAATTPDTKAPDAKAPDTKAPSATTPSGTGAGTSTMGTAWPSNVTVITPQKGKKVEASGSLASGQKITELGLPTSCISAGDKDKFAGNQVLFGATLPAKNEMTITVTPTDATKNLNVYAYTQPSDRFALPGSVAGPSACKSAVKAGWRGDQHQRSIKLTGGKETENLVIGVAGGADMTTGDFTIAIESH